MRKVVKAHVRYRWPMGSSTRSRWIVGAFVDPSQTPTLHVARFARKSVTACLTGDGSDESFGGYGRCAIASRLRFWIDNLPMLLRRSLAELVLSQPSSRWNRLVSKPPLPSCFGLRGKLSGNRLHKRAQFLKLESTKDF